MNPSSCRATRLLWRAGHVNLKMSNPVTPSWDLVHNPAIFMPRIALGSGPIFYTADHLFVCEL